MKSGASLAINQRSCYCTTLVQTLNVKFDSRDVSKFKVSKKWTKWLETPFKCCKNVLENAAGRTTCCRLLGNYRGWKLIHIWTKKNVSAVLFINEFWTMKSPLCIRLFRWSIYSWEWLYQLFFRSVFRIVNLNVELLTVSRNSWFMLNCFSIADQQAPIACQLINNDDIYFLCYIAQPIHMQSGLYITHFLLIKVLRLYHKWNHFQVSLCVGL